MGSCDGQAVLANVRKEILKGHSRCLLLVWQFLKDRKAAKGFMPVFAFADDDAW